jgi:salicylate hydroxylase
LRRYRPSASVDATLPSNIIVLGAGIGDLATAHTRSCVTVLESARELGEVGAGINVSPKAMRLLRR